MIDGAAIPDEGHAVGDNAQELETARPPADHESELLLRREGSTNSIELAGGADTVEETRIESLQSLESVIDEIGTTRKHWACVLTLGLANASDAVEVLAIGYIVTVFKDPVTGRHIDELPEWSSLLTSSVFFGMLFGGLFSGGLGDRFGRKPLLSSSLALNASSAMLSALTILLPAGFQLYWLVFFRFIGGLGVGGSVPAAFALGSELGPATSRSNFINCIACFWSVGVLYTSICAYVLLHGSPERGNNWPYFAALVALPASLAGLLCLTVLEESPRYLWIVGEREKAASVLYRFAGSSQHDGGELQKCIKDLSSKYPTQRVITASSTFTSILVVLRNMKAVILGPTRRRLMLLCGIFSALSFAHYGISLWISDLFRKVHFDDPYITSIFYTLATVPGLVAAIMLLDRIGRRYLTGGSMFVACIAAFLFAMSGEMKWLVVLSAGLFNASAASAWSGLDLFSAELLPAQVRSTGLGITIAFGRVGSVFANVYNSFVLAGDDDAMSVNIVLLSASVAMLVAAALVFRLPETMGVSHLA
mmetsp:Transcript_23214/g.43276  ORF Transcript_23214/g.43276 Transcript_23214/m.43276 type:complete len:536 (-) Transcript_23214:206-1813(-)